MSSIFSIAGAAHRYRVLRRSQYWGDEELRAYTGSALDEILREAARIPFYSSRWGGLPRAEDLSKLRPIRRCEVAALNESVFSLYPEGFAPSSHSSSGSTGMPARFLFDAHHQRGRMASRMRYLRAFGWSPFSSTAWLLYHVFRPPHNEDELLMRSPLRMRSHFLPASPGLEGKVEELCRIDPRFLYTFPSYLEILLNRLRETGQKLPSLKKIFSGAEVLEDSLRQRTRKELGVEIAQNYGSTEAFLAFECPAGKLHLNAEHVMLELVDDHGHAVAPGEIGKVLITTLENRLAPLVRYEIGDYAIAARGSCECGRTLPLIGKIIGRAMNLFRRGEGELISPWHLSSAVRKCLEVKQFQIVQTSMRQFIVRYVSDCPLVPEAMETIRHGFRKVLGQEVSVDFIRVSDIPRTAGGKYMTALSEMVE